MGLRRGIAKRTDLGNYSIALELLFNQSHPIKPTWNIRRRVLGPNPGFCPTVILKMSQNSDSRILGGVGMFRHPSHNERFFFP